MNCDGRGRVNALKRPQSRRRWFRSHGTPLHNTKRIAIINSDGPPLKITVRGISLFFSFSLFFSILPSRCLEPRASPLITIETRASKKVRLGRAHAERVFPATLLIKILCGSVPRVETRLARTRAPRRITSGTFHAARNTVTRKASSVSRPACAANEQIAKSGYFHSPRSVTRSPTQQRLIFIRVLLRLHAVQIFLRSSGYYEYYFWHVSALNALQLEFTQQLEL